MVARHSRGAGTCFISPKLPVFKPRELVALLKSHGYEEISQSGSHLKMRKETITVVVSIKDATFHPVWLPRLGARPELVQALCFNCRLFPSQVSGPARAGLFCCFRLCRGLENGIGTILSQSLNFLSETMLTILV